MKIHKITDEERSEINSIRNLLMSRDEESIKLGISLLDNYPFNSRIYIPYINRFSQKLGITLYQYNEVSKYYSGLSCEKENEWFWRKRILYFINGCLAYGKFYA